MAMLKKKVVPAAVKKARMAHAVKVPKGKTSKVQRVSGG